MRIQGHTAKINDTKVIDFEFPAWCAGFSINLRMKKLIQSVPSI